MLKFRYGFRCSTMAVCCIVVCLSGKPAKAFDVFWTAGTSSWNNAGNWDSGDVPDVFFEDVPRINNGGTATLNAAALADAGGLILGENGSDSGTLHIQSGGSLNLVEGTGAATGVANIGLNGGTGLLQVDGGGAFSTTLVDMNSGSTLDIGSGTGTASVISTDGMWLAGRTVTHGGGHTFSAATFVTFEGGAEYVVDLTSASHTTLTAAGAISGVQGPLVVQTSGGYTPSLGTTWTLLDGESVTGGFAVDTSETTLAAGTGYVTRTIDGGNGQQLTLTYQAMATLTVNTDTGALSVSSESGVPIDLVGYSVLSASGQLDPMNWNSLADQSQPGWVEAGGSANSLNELNAENSTALSSTSVSLGSSVYVTPEFGVSPDITFEYGVDGEATKLPGIVKFTGSRAANNLLLTVDPDTGEGQLKNSSTYTIDVLGYTITSESGSLDDANWTSLASQSVSGWVAAASDEYSLNELVPEDPVTTLTPGQSLSLGDMFLTSGMQDLDLSFAVSIDGSDPVVQQGTVWYTTIPAGLPGDYNDDGFVDAADYTVWRDALSAGAATLTNRSSSITGPVSEADYVFWKANFGATAGAGAAAEISSLAAVPEPASICLFVVAALAWTAVGRPSLKCRRA